ncbi:MAG: translation elongation factor Ts [Fibrobacterota bacterium]
MIIEVTASAVKELREKSGAGMMQCKKALQETSGDVEKAIEYLRKQGQIQAGKRSGRTAKEGKIASAIQGNTAVMLELNSETDFVSRNDDFNALLGNLVQVALEKQPVGLEAFEAASSAVFGNRTVKDAVMEKAGIIGENISLRRVMVLHASADEKIFTYIHMGGKIGVLLTLKGEASALGHNKVLEAGKDFCMHIAASSPIALKKEDVPADKIASETEIFKELARKEGKPEKMLDKIVQGRVEKFFKENCLVDQPFVKNPDKSVSQVLAEAGKEAGSAVSLTAFVRYQLGSE